MISGVTRVAYKGKFQTSVKNKTDCSISDEPMFKDAIFPIDCNSLCEDRIKNIVTNVFFETHLTTLHLPCHQNNFLYWRFIW